MLFAVYSCDTLDKCGDGTHLAMIWEGSGDASVKKLLKKIFKERKAYFGIPRKMDFAEFYGLYERGGLEAVSNVMDGGYIDILHKNEWVNE